MLTLGIGSKIKGLISKNKATKIFVAEKLGITRQTLDDYINEKTSITVEKLTELANLFDYEVYRFFIDDKNIELGGDGIDISNGVSTFSFILFSETTKPSFFAIAIIMSKSDFFSP